MRILVLMNLLISLSFAEVLNFKKGAFACKNSNKIKGYWKAYDSGKMLAYRYLVQNNCTIIKNNAWNIVEEDYAYSRICNKKKSCYWIEKDFLY